MQLNKMSKEELDILSYTDLTELILKEQKKPLTTPVIFKTICNLLEYSEEEYVDKIGDYYTSLTTDKRFIFLDEGTWDLSTLHPVKIELDDDDEVDEEIIEEETEEEADSIEQVVDDEQLDDDDDDMDDLTMLTEEELDEND